MKMEPCPFCGEEEKVFPNLKEGDEDELPVPCFTVVHDCPVLGSMIVCDGPTEEQAEARWNTRHNPQLTPLRKKAELYDLLNDPLLKKEYKDQNGDEIALHYYVQDIFGFKFFLGQCTLDEVIDELREMLNNEKANPAIIKEALK